MVRWLAGGDGDLRCDGQGALLRGRLWHLRRAQRRCCLPTNTSIATEWLPEARRYYTNIVGKYGPQVQALLKKAARHRNRHRLPAARARSGAGTSAGSLTSTRSGLPDTFPRSKAVVIAYASVYGNTQNAAQTCWPARLARQGRDAASPCTTYPVTRDPYRHRLGGFPLTAIWCSPPPPITPAFSSTWSTALRDICRPQPAEPHRGAVWRTAPGRPTSGNQMRDHARQGRKGMTILEDTVTHPLHRATGAQLEQV